MQVNLVAIQRDGTLAQESGPLPEVAQSVIAQMLRLYESVGWNFPWVGYLAFEDNVCVGTCAFKGPPKNDAVEIAYHTFPEHEGHGVATRMAERLYSLAKAEALNICVTAQTLPEENASTRVLRKLGFVLKGSVIDPEIGTAWEWFFDENAKS
jgi:ribosomal-protein-alanine N-acetyltransferase